MDRSRSRFALATVSVAVTAAVGTVAVATGCADTRPSPERPFVFAPPQLPDAKPDPVVVPGDVVMPEACGLVEVAPATRYSVEAAALIARAAGGQVRWRWRLAPGEAVVALAPCGEASVAVVAAAPGGAGQRVVVVDDDGATRWERAVPELAVVRVSCGRDGEVALGGRVARGVDLDPGAGEARAPGRGGFVVGLASDGEARFTRFLPGDDDQQVDVLVDGAGGVYVASAFVARVDADPGPGHDLVTTTGSSFVVRHLDATGRHDWAYAPDGAFAWRRSMATTADGGVMLGGTFRGEVDFDPRGVHQRRDAINVDYTAFVVRLSPAGALTWIWTAPIAGLSTVADVAPRGACVLAFTHLPAAAGDIDPGPAVVVPDEIHGTAAVALDLESGSWLGVVARARWEPWGWTLAPMRPAADATCGGWPARPCAIAGLHLFASPGSDDLQAVGTPTGTFVSTTFHGGLPLPDAEPIGGGSSDGVVLHLDRRGRIDARVDVGGPGAQEVTASQVIDGELLVDTRSRGSGGVERVEALLVGPDGGIRWRRPVGARIAVVGPDRICSVTDPADARRIQVGCVRRDGSELWRLPIPGDPESFYGIDLALAPDASLEVCPRVLTPQAPPERRCFVVDARGRRRSGALAPTPAPAHVATPAALGRGYVVGHGLAGTGPAAASSTAPVWGRGAPWVGWMSDGVLRWSRSLGTMHGPESLTAVHIIELERGVAISVRCDEARSDMIWEVGPGHLVTTRTGTIEALFAVDRAGERLGQWAIADISRNGRERLDFAAGRPFWSGTFVGLAELDPGPMPRWVASTGFDGFIVSIEDFPVDRVGRVVH